MFEHGYRKELYRAHTAIKTLPCRLILGKVCVNQHKRLPLVEEFNSFYFTDRLMIDFCVLLVSESTAMARIAISL